MSETPNKDPALPEISESQTEAPVDSPPPVDGSPSTDEVGADAPPSETPSVPVVEEIESPPPSVESAAVVEEIEPPPPSPSVESAAVVEESEPPPPAVTGFSAEIKEMEPPPPPSESAAAVEETTPPPAAEPVEEAATADAPPPSAEPDAPPPAAEPDAPPPAAEPDAPPPAAEPDAPPPAAESDAPSPAAESDAPPSADASVSVASSSSPPSSGIESDAANIAAAAANIASAAASIASAAAKIAGPGHPNLLANGVGGAAASGAGSASMPLATPVDPEDRHLYKDRVNFGDYVNWVGEKPAVVRTRPGEAPGEKEPGTVEAAGMEPGTAEAATKEPGAGETAVKEPGETPTKEPVRNLNEAQAGMPSGGHTGGESEAWKLEKDPTGLKADAGANANNANVNFANAATNQSCGTTSGAEGALAAGSQATGAIGKDGSKSYENQPWVLERNPSQIVQTQTDAEGNSFQNDKGSDCTPKPGAGTGACEGCSHAHDQCFPNQTECIDLEYTQLVGVAQDFADVAQDLFQETKQLGWYIVAQCLQFMDDDICDPCACRNTTDTESALAEADGASDGSATANGNPQDINVPADGSVADEKLETNPETMGEVSEKPEPVAAPPGETPELLEDLPEGEEPAVAKEPSEMPLGGIEPSATDSPGGDPAKDPSQMAAIESAAEVASTTAIPAETPATVAVAAETPLAEGESKPPGDPPA